jgi:hypothetical protein
MTQELSKTAAGEFLASCKKMRTPSFVVIACLFSLIFIMSTWEQAVVRLLYHWDWQPNFDFLGYLAPLISENWGFFLAGDLPILSFPVVSIVLLRSAPRGQLCVLGLLTLFMIVEWRPDPGSTAVDLDILAIHWLFAVVTLLVSGLYALRAPRERTN